MDNFKAPIYPPVIPPTPTPPPPPDTTPFIPANPGRPRTGGQPFPDKSITEVKPAPEVSKIKTTPIELDQNDKPEELAKLFLTDIGGREIATFSRHDQINGIAQEYSPIKNLTDISLEYNPLTIAQNADNVSTYLTTFNFDISKYVPTQAELDEKYPLEADSAKRTVVYLDKEDNSLNIHVKNIFVNEKIEVEFIIPQEVKDGTIYT